MAPNADTPEEAPAGAESDAPPITINAQYIKDLSFEAPASPGIFGTMRNAAPDINVNIDVNAVPIADSSAFEVVLDITANCTVEETSAFILELSYAGLFSLNVPEEHLQAILLIECPRLLFPFARNVLADVSRDGGFPPLMLGPVDFVSMYQSQLQQATEAEGGESDEAEGEGDS